MLKFNLQELKNAISDFYQITKFMTVLYDEKFNTILSSPVSMSDFCREVRRSRELTIKCHGCDLYGLEYCKKNKIGISYRCHMGLTEAVVPILSGGTPIGYLMLGQAVNGDDLKEVEKNVELIPDGYGIDKEVLLKSLSKLSLTSVEQLSATVRLLDMCASYLADKEIVRVEENERRDAVEKYILDNLASPDLSMRSISKKFSISRSTLYTLSCDYFGMGISDYIRVCRIEKAKKLLLKGGMPIYEVAAACGFSAPNHFTKTFREMVGVLPKDYANQKRQKIDVFESPLT